MIIAARSNKERTNRKQERVNKIFMHLQTSDSPPSWSIQALVIRHLHNLFFTTFSWFDYAIAFQYHITIIISAELPQLRFPRRLCSDWAGDLTLTMKTVATKAETEDPRLEWHHSHHRRLYISLNSTILLSFSNSGNDFYGAENLQVRGQQRRVISILSGDRPRCRYSLWRPHPNMEDQTLYTNRKNNLII